MEQTCTNETNQSQWSSFVCTSLEGTIPHLEFSIEIQSNNLTYQGNPYTERQQYRHKPIMGKKMGKKNYPTGLNL